MNLPPLSPYGREVAPSTREVLVAAAPWAVLALSALCALIAY